jgi:hypothetical protein
MNLGVEDISVAADVIRNWNATCESTHKKCHTTRQNMTPSLPTRVLEIQGYRQIRLYTSQSNERGQYVCLSHCWGDTMPLQTTSTTIRHFEETGIPWETLPKTFQDAVDISHLLGIKYVWIDSLCIIQNDVEDWRHEGSKMSDIYSGAYVTLAASSASDSDGGFYQEISADREQWYLTYNFSNHKVEGATYKISVRQRRKYLETNFEMGLLPLSMRAWAFQERLLSTRVIHFADDLLYWECLNGRMCESKDGLNNPFDNAVNSILYDSSGSRKVHEAARIWHMIVEDYTSRKLTFSKDILPALQGVAKHMQKERRCAYYAGLWEDDFHHDLLWSVEQCSTVRQSEYRAPSWSWASTEGGVTWRFRNDRVDKCQAESSIVMAETIPSGDDPLGEITSGKLIIKALCLPGLLYYTTNPTQDVALKVNNWDNTSANMWFMPDHALETQEDQHVMLVLIASYIYSGSRCYLVLRPIDEHKRNFERVGLAEEGSDTPHLQCSLFNPTVRERIDKGLAHEGCAEYQEFTII